MGKIEDIGKVIKDLIAGGRTRFLMAGLIIAAECFLAWKTEADPLVYWIVAGIGGLFIVSKTLTDVFGHKYAKKVKNN